MTEPQPIDDLRFLFFDLEIGNRQSKIENNFFKRFSHEAMATTFELLIVHEDERYASQAAAAAFDEVDQLERELSRFLESSDVTRVNNLPANQPLQLSLDTFECLKIAERIYAETNGAFDITIGTLLKCWRNEDGSPHEPQGPSPKEIDLARLRTGMNLLQLNEAEHTIKLSVSGVQIDLGGIGKGYAVDRVAELLRDWSIDVALISGGYSSVLALDAPHKYFRLPIADCRSKSRISREGCLRWKIENRQLIKGWPVTMTNPAGDKEILARPFLKNAALSGSGVQKGGHIIEPRTARAVEGRRAAWASAPDAATADALSTAFMIMGIEEIEKYCSLHPETLAMVILDKQSLGLLTEDGEVQQEILRFGKWESIIK